MQYTCSCKVWSVSGNISDESNSINASKRNRHSDFDTLTNKISLQHNLYRVLINRLKNFFVLHNLTFLISLPSSFNFRNSLHTLSSMPSASKMTYFVRWGVKLYSLTLTAFQFLHLCYNISIFRELMQISCTAL